VAANGALEVWLIMIVFDEPIVESLMIAFEVVVFGELVYNIAEMALAYRNNFRAPDMPSWRVTDPLS